MKKLIDMFELDLKPIILDMVNKVGNDDNVQVSIYTDDSLIVHVLLEQDDDTPNNEVGNDIYVDLTI